MAPSFADAAALAARQNGRITTAQLNACGFESKAIQRSVAAGRLHRVHVGVFALGHVAPSRLGDWHGAVLACGAVAELSVRCAATLLGIRDGVGPRIDVTIPGTSGRKRPGIEVHHADLLDVERTTRFNIPVTSPARTMVDLAHHLQDRDSIEWALREMQHKRMYERELLELSNRRRPSRSISALLSGALAPTGSPLEVAFVNRVVRRHGLQMPDCQARRCGFHVDFCWEAALLIVEVDGRGHDQPLMRLADAHRDAALEAAGYLVLRLRWADIHRFDGATATIIRDHLRTRGRCDL